MNRQELYLSICQAIGTDNAKPGLEKITDFDRPCTVVIARNSSGNISNISIEFTGYKARFLCSVLFDGNGDQSTGFSNFSMPKVKLNPRQRATVLLCCLKFLIDNGLIAADINYFCDRVVAEHSLGQGEFIANWEAVLLASKAYIKLHPEFAMAHKRRPSFSVVEPTVHTF